MSLKFRKKVVQKPKYRESFLQVHLPVWRGWSRDVGYSIFFVNGWNGRSLTPSYVAHTIRIKVCLLFLKKQYKIRGKMLMKLQGDEL